VNGARWVMPITMRPAAFALRTINFVFKSMRPWSSSTRVE